eukprot:gene10956-12117_t
MWSKTKFVYKIFSSLSVLFMTLDSDLQGADCDSTINVDKHLDLGKKLLAAGQLTEALSHYHAAVEGDPNNYLTYFKRAAVYLALGRSKAALPDLDEVIQLRPDFVKARTERGNIRLKQGDLDAALDDFEMILSMDHANQAALSQINIIEPTRQDVAQGRSAMQMGDYGTAIDALSKAIEVCPWDAKLRQMRAECYEITGDLIKAIGDLRGFDLAFHVYKPCVLLRRGLTLPFTTVASLRRPTLKLIPDNTNGYLKISKLHYKMGEADESLKEIRECLKLDQDHQQCFQHYKKVKKLVKFLTDSQRFIDDERYEDALLKLKAAFKVEPKEHAYYTRLMGDICHCQMKLGKSSEAIKACTDVLGIDENDIEAYCDRADAYLLEENYDAAIKDFQAAKNINGDYKRAHEGLDRAQKLLKQSKKRDYYKVLGIKRNASKKDILKAYRKLAVKWHPDHYKGNDRKKAEKMFIDIASAKEVLSDPEKRQKFDNGEDPLDPEQQQHGGGGPFPFEGGFPFGEGFSFKFHF